MEEYQQTFFRKENILNQIVLQSDILMKRIYKEESVREKYPKIQLNKIVYFLTLVMPYDLNAIV